MKKSYLILLLIFILCYMLIDPVHGMEGVKNGLLLWYDRILPALLPFSIISYILVASDNLSFFSRILHPVIKKLIPVSPRNPLYGTDIVYGTLLVKISKGNVSGCLVDIDRCDRCRYFLDQGKSVFGIFFIGPVDKFF